MVYSKPPFAGPAKVLNYLGRYTHRVAISNHRLLAADNGQVRFHWRNYRHHGKRKTMTLDAAEFVRRFLLHVLPPQFRRIRYFGFLAARHRRQRLALCRKLLGMPASDPDSDSPDYRERLEQLTGSSLSECPACRVGSMLRAGRFEPGDAPARHVITAAAPVQCNSNSGGRVIPSSKLGFALRHIPFNIRGPGLDRTCVRGFLDVAEPSRTSPKRSEQCCL